MSQGESRRLLTEREVEANFGIKKTMLRAWRTSARAQPLAFVRLSAGSVRYCESDVLAFINARRVRPTPANEGQTTR